MYMGREEQDYGRYMDSFNAWQNERDYLAGRYDSERDYDYGKWETGRAQAYDEYTADKSLAYDEHSAGRDLAWKEYLANMEKEQAAAELMAGAGDYGRIAQMYGLSEDELKALTDANAPKGTGGDVTDGHGAAGYDNQGLSESRIKEVQKALGVTADGKWGSESQAAAGGLSATEAYDVLRKGGFDDPNRGGSNDGNGNGFTGKTYSEATAYLQSKGVSGASASAIMTENEWKRRKNSYNTYGTGGAEVANYDTYQEYLADII
jgi:hypothetical protein